MADRNTFCIVISSDYTGARFLKLKITKKRKKVQNKCTFNVPLSTSTSNRSNNKKQVYSYIILGNALFQLFLNSIRQALRFIYTTLMNKLLLDLVMKNINLVRHHECDVIRT